MLAVLAPEVGRRDLHSGGLQLLDRALPRRGRLLAAERLLEPAQRVAQLELAEELAQPRAVGLLAHQVLDVDLHRHVADGRGQLLRHARVIGVVGQVLLALGA